MNYMFGAEWMAQPGLCLQCKPDGLSLDPQRAAEHPRSKLCCGGENSSLSGAHRPILLNCQYQAQQETPSEQKMVENNPGRYPLTSGGCVYEHTDSPNCTYTHIQDTHTWKLHVIFFTSLFGGWHVHPSAHMRKSEDSLWKLVFLFYHVGSGD